MTEHGHVQDEEKPLTDMQVSIEMTQKSDAVANETRPDGKQVVDDKGGKKEAVKKPMASLAEFYQNATLLDYFLMFWGTIGAVVTGISVPYFQLLFGQMLDALNTDPSGFASQVAYIAEAFVVIAAINVVSGSLQVTCWSYTGERQCQRLREQYVEAILKQEIGWFDACGASELATRVADNIGEISEGLGHKTGDLIQYLTQFVASFVVALYLCWKLTVVLFCCFPFIAFGGYLMVTAVSAHKTKSLEQYAAAGGIATEALSAVRTVTAINAQPDIITRYRVFLLDAMNVGIKKGLNVGIGFGVIFSSIFASYSLGFWWGSQLVADDIERGCYPGSTDSTCITGGKIVSTFFCVLMGSVSMGQIGPPMAALSAARTALVPILQLLARVPLIDGLSDKGEKPENAPEGTIELKNIRFAYPTRPDILVCNNYNLRVEKGQSIALVGASGCGKSTIVNLLLRFYDPQDGAVLLDGRNIRDLNVRWLRSHIGYVGQEPVLFTGSIQDNIIYGLDTTISSTLSKEEKEARVIAAAKLANAHDFIMNFPNGYNTDVGSSGVALSGGQKQRIAIARALVKQPAVLLLDEATSALDAVSEKQVQHAIDQLQTLRSQTTIIIAHRLNTIRHADKIAAIKDGNVHELGTHDELIALDGIYADLVRLQMNAQDSGNGDAMGKKTTSADDLAAALAADLAPLQVVAASATTTTDAATDAVASQDKSQSSNPGSNKSTSGASAATDSKKSKDSTKAKEPEKAKLTKEDTRRLTSKVWALIMEQKLMFFIAVVGCIAYGALFPVWGLVLGQNQSTFYYRDADRLRVVASSLGIYFLILAIVSLLSSIAQYWAMAEVGERVSLRLRSDLFEAIMRREISYFDKEENGPGSLAARLSDDSRNVTKATGESTVKLMQAVFTLLIGLGIGLSASWKIALVVLAVMPVNVIAQKIRLNAMVGQNYDTHGKDGGEGNEGAAGSQSQNPANAISSAFTHMRTVAAFSMTFTVADMYARATRKVSEERSFRSVTAGIAFGLSNTSQFLMYALLFWYGSTLIHDSNITFENLMVAMLSLMLGAVGLGSALNDLGDQQEGMQAAYRIFTACEEGKNSPIDGLSESGISPPERAKGRIELKDVSFRYPTRPDVEVCKKYNLVIEPGQVVALVGPSGSGKSTLMGLLLRWYDPDSGEVLLDGQNIRDLNVRWLRSQIGYVGQEPVLFQGSVAENVAKGRADFGNNKLETLDSILSKSGGNKDKKQVPPPKSEGSNNNQANYETIADVESAVASGDVDDDIIQACKASNAHDFITSFSNGYHTDVGEGSIMVSGGQKQRIAIARALVKQPAVLLLDEATSALDSASEMMVQQSIDALQQSHAQTTIIIAHRLSTIINSDKIFVIDQGCIVEEGTHSQLLALDGLYKKLWMKQCGQDE